MLMVGSAAADSRTFKVTYDTIDGSVVEEAEQEIKCYQYTWLGAVEEDTNKTISCDSKYEHMNIPCYEPLVWTEDPNRQNQPNLTLLKDRCETGNLQGKVCVPFCSKNDDDVCIKVTYYNRDDEHTPTNTTSFCGKGIDITDDGEAIKDGCITELNVDGQDVEVCFCNTPFCNSAVHLDIWPYTKFIVSLVTTVIYSRILY